jgi:hypothetical protein
VYLRVCTQGHMGNILACLCMGFRPFNTSVHHVPAEYDG